MISISQKSIQPHVMTDFSLCTISVLDYDLIAAEFFLALLPSVIVTERTGPMG